MTSHAHAWSPIPGEVARYSCACSVTGYRARTGEIREHRTRIEIAKQWTACGQHTDMNGRVPPKPGDQ